MILINWSWSFSFFWTIGFLFLQVIWVIGISMIILAFLLKFSQKTILIVSLSVIFLHNFADGINPSVFGSVDWFWKFLHSKYAWIPFNDKQSFGISIVYPIIPWFAVMSFGYIIGTYYLKETLVRKKQFINFAIIAIILFLFLRITNLYGDPQTWSFHERGPWFTFLDFLNTSKYPPSLQFLLMTIGPAFLFLAYTEKINNAVSSFLTVFGKVPFFFYILHFPLLNLASLLYHYFKYDKAFSFFTSSRKNWPENYEASVLTIYIVWILTLILTYFLCRCYLSYKQNNDHWWLKYI